MLSLVRNFSFKQLFVAECIWSKSLYNFILTFGMNYLVALITNKMHLSS